VSQDTDFDTTPRKVGLDWVVSKDKRYFLGQASLARMASFPLNRRLAAIKFPGKDAPDEGAQLLAGQERVGFVTSCRYSPGLDFSVALGWISTINDSFPTDLVAVSRGGRRTPGQVAAGAFYDPHGERLRA